MAKFFETGEVIGGLLILDRVSGDVVSRAIYLVQCLNCSEMYETTYANLRIRIKKQLNTCRQCAERPGKPPAVKSVAFKGDWAATKSFPSDDVWYPM